jgi:hypothetical protein
LDATVDWAEGKISGRELLVSAGLALGLSVVGGGAAKVGAKELQRLGPESATSLRTPAANPTSISQGRDRPPQTLGVGCHRT